MKKRERRICGKCGKTGGVSFIAIDGSVECGDCAGWAQFDNALASGLTPIRAQMWGRSFWARGLFLHSRALMIAAGQ